MRMNSSLLTVTFRNKRHCKQTAFCIAHTPREYRILPILVLQAIHKAHERTSCLDELVVIILLSPVVPLVHSNSDAESPTIYNTIPVW